MSRYKNLRAEMARNGIRQGKLAEMLGMGLATMSLKMNGKNDFTLAEAKAIRDIVSPLMTLDKLFEADSYD